MTTPNLSPLFDRINARAYAILQQHGKTLEQLQGYTLEELNAIKGIGDRWATDIRAALDSLQPVPAVAQPPDLSYEFTEETLAADYVDEDAPTAIEPVRWSLGEVIDADEEILLKAVLGIPQEPAANSLEKFLGADEGELAPPAAETALDMALRYLRGCGREADAEVLAGKVDRDGADVVVETAIAILEGLPGGALPKNLAQDVRERAGL